MEKENSAVQNLEEEENTNVKINETATKKRCPKCQALIETNMSFCPECGEALIIKCFRCGAETQADNSFCNNCGQKLDMVMDNRVSNTIANINSKQKKPKINGLAIVNCPNLCGQYKKAPYGR